MEKQLTRLDEIFKNIFAHYRTKIKNPAVLLSGGIDCSVIAFWVKKTFSAFTPVCLISSESKDDFYMEIACRFLKSKPVWVEFTQEEIVANLELVKKVLVSKKIKPDLTQLSLALASYFVFKKISSLGIKSVFSGQGPDILLAGYHRYRTAENLNQAIRQDLPMLEIDRKREEGIAQIFPLEIIYPYLEKQFVDFCMNLPSELKLHQSEDKYLLRCYGRKIGLPIKIVNRPKKAFQYSCGIHKMLKKNFSFK